MVFGIYWLYALAVVPFIEPSADPRPEQEGLKPNLPLGKSVVEMQRESLTPWFKPGDWELTSPKVFESPRGKLLLHSYETLADGRLEITPCTLIFMPGGDDQENDADRNRRAVILQAPQGAILRFDTPVDLKQMKIGKLVGGTMRGPITIRSDQRLPGPQDDLLITTRDAELVGDRIITPHPVDFRLGLNRGSGRDLDIHLAPSSNPAPNSPAPGFGGVNSITLKQDVRMRLHPGQADMFPSPSAPARAAPAAPAGAHDNPPVDITCDGAFQFDVTRFAATFRKHVDVLRVNADGPSDQLNCEVLSVFFEPMGEAAKAPKSAAGRGDMPKLEPSRVEAEGDPVVIRSPSRGVQARGTRLEYDIKKNAGGLKGPGWLKAITPNDASARPVEATWSRELEFGPYQGVQCAKLAGAAAVESAGVGLLKAETIRLFLLEDPTPPANASGRRRLVPDRLQAFERVHFESPTLTGDVHHLQVWLRRPKTPGVGLAAAAAKGAARSPIAPSNSNNTDAAATGAPANPLASATANGAPTRQMHVAGDLLQVEALIGEKATDVTRVHMEGKVRLRETQVATPGERPFLIQGDKLDVDQPVPNHAVVHVMGSPAHIEAREMTIDGSDIHLDRAKNHAWVNGRGVMTLVVPADATNQAAGKPQPLEITWKGQMDFDGREASFRDGVTAVMQRGRLTPEGAPLQEHQRLTCDLLQAIFEPRVQFGEMDPRVRPQVNRVICQNNVFLEQRTTQAGKQSVLERMKTLDLMVQPASGDILARGPGWVRRVWVDTGTGMPHLPGMPQAPPPTAPTGERLAYLGINFQGQVSGNQTRQTMEFQDRVRCVYSPTPDWDTIVEPDDPDKLSDGAVLLTSDRLRVMRTPATAPGQQPFELAATGNARLDGRANLGAGRAAADPTKPAHRGQTYSASAARLTYVAAKDLLVLEGDGRNYAYLARQVRVGAPYDEQSAGKFLFWPSLNQLQVQDAHQLNIQNLETGAPQRQSSNGAPSTPPAGLRR